MRQVPKNGGIDFGRENMGIKIYPMDTYYVFVCGYVCWFNNRHIFVDFFLAVTRLRRYVKKNRFFTFFEIF